MDQTREKSACIVHLAFELLIHIAENGMYRALALAHHHIGGKMIDNPLTNLQEWTDSILDIPGSPTHILRGRFVESTLHIEHMYISVDKFDLIINVGYKCIGPQSFKSGSQLFLFGPQYRIVVIVDIGEIVHDLTGIFEGLGNLLGKSRNRI